MRIKILFSLFFFVSFVYAQSDLSDIEARLDSLGEYAGSTVIGKDDSPVAVSGDFVVRFAHTDYTKTATLQGSENLRTFINSALTATIVVSPASFLTLFSNLYLPFDFSGFYTNEQAFTPNPGNIGGTGERVQWFHPSADFYGASINENMLAGLDMRGGQFGATLFMGGVIWTTQSPLTVWERETSPRFISQYELYEEEKVVSTYYKEKGFKPVKEGGRAFWTNRSFGGMLLDVHTLPWNFKGQLMLSQPNSVDIGTRDGLRLNTRDNSELAMIGTYDYRGSVIGGRFAKEKIDFDQASLTIGANYMGITFDPEQIYETNVFPYVIYPDSSVKFENLRVATIDLKGNLNPQFFLSFDLALSWDDTTSFRPSDPSCLSTNPSLFNYVNAKCYDASKYSSSPSTPAFGLYVKAQDKHWEPITLELIYLPKDFYSPYSMANPDRVASWRKDQFYVGAGTFRYGPNMVGANLKLEPEFDRGRFDVQYGIHRQVEEGADIINYKYNLVGRYIWETSTSWTKHKPFFNADSGYDDKLRRYTYRLARGPASPKFKLSDQSGGLRSGYAETWDAFAAYDNAQDAFYCAQFSYFNDSARINGQVPCNMPTNVKWNSSVAVDMGYDIGHWFGTDRNIMLQLYTALSGVSKSFIPVAYTDKYDNDMLMWNWFAQSEPAIAITPKFHAILILGIEMFRAEKAYAELVLNPTASPDNLGAIAPPSSYGELYKKGIIYDYKLSPINIRHTSLGFGFDWDFASRAGLHFRYKYLTSKDENLPQNDWNVHYVQAETKVWF
ncbi:MAG: hypothetical protein LBC75_09250 [Fibromonadaceae bacterium]|jgi:hypothetical protein|nr:hypothetical protein [Fibromonadaceae bacterium]